MKPRRTRYFGFVLAMMLAITSFALTAQAEQPLNLSDAQVFRIQALLLTQSKEIRSLSANVEAAQQTLSAAIAKGDPVLTATAVLSLDAAEKALKNVQLAQQRNLLSVLTDSQKQLVKPASIPASD